MSEESDEKNDGKCTHRKYSVSTKMVVVSLREINAHQLVMKVSVKCPDCGKSYMFHGRPGFSTVEATVSSDYDEVIIPVDYPDDDDDLRPTQNPPAGVLH